ncbi:MAG: LysR family transcriptional regulator [Holosporales bacterium]|jgi:DNA-binding transcriptional LysR family regulator|nr:LysR family transcriptional regulator [Holosporales bacterium]
MIEELKNFIKFAEGGRLSVLNIPENLFLSQMHSIEDEIRHKLVKRIDKVNVVLTEFGRRFVPYAARVVETISNGVSIVNEWSSYDLDNQLTIGLPRDSATTWALNCIKGFNKRQPGLRVTLFTENKLTTNMLENMNVMFWPVESILSEYDAYWYIEFKYGLYASDRYIKVRGEPTLDNIKQHTIIAYSGRDNNAKLSNWHLYGEYGLPIINPSVFSQSRDLINKMVSDGVGIGALSDRQEVYYGYENLKRVVKEVCGPVMKNYFMVRKGMNEIRRYNMQLINSLFRNYFEQNGVKVFDLI